MKLLSIEVWSVALISVVVIGGVVTRDRMHPAPPPSAPPVPPGLPSAPPEHSPPITDADIEAIRAGRRSHRVRCDAANGVYLSFDDVCLKKDALIKERTIP